MPQPSFDPGLATRGLGGVTRLVNADGSFNVTRTGVPLKETGLYLYLMNISWFRFSAFLLALYTAVNLFFAGIYFVVGMDQLKGIEPGTVWENFLGAFFFSAQTLTTVGYGHVAPATVLTSAISSFEALVGLSMFALVTGLIYGRFSHPSARLRFSKPLLLAPYQGGDSLQFRLAHLRSNVLVDAEATLILSTIDAGKADGIRKYQLLKLELPKINFLALTWTVVHAIDPQSPLYGKSKADLEAMNAEWLVLIRAYDDTFSQVVHSRRSYVVDDLVTNARFLPAYHPTADGRLQLNLNELDLTEQL